MAEIEYELSMFDVLKFSEHSFKNTPHIQKAIRRNQAQIPGFISVVALFYWFYYQEALTAVYIGSIGVLWGLVIPHYIRWNLLGQVKDKYKKEDRDKMFGVYKLTAEKNVLIETSPQGKQSTIKWEDILRVETTKQHAFIFTDINEAIIVPRKSVKKGDIREFVSFADERIEDAAW